MNIVGVYRAIIGAVGRAVVRVIFETNARKAIIIALLENGCSRS
jgi:hypothetical protein